MILQDEFNKILDTYEQYIKNGGPKTSSDKIGYLNAVFNSMNMITKLLCISSNGVDVDSVVLTEEQKSKRTAIGNRLFRSTISEAVKTSDNSPKAAQHEIPVGITNSTVLNTSNNKEENTMPTKKSISTDKKTTSNGAVKKSKTISEKKKATTEKPATKKTTKKSKELTEAQAKMKAIEDAVAGKTASDIIREELDAWGVPSEFFAYKALVELPNLVKHAPKYNEIVDLVSEHFGKSKPTVSSAFTSLMNRADFSKSIYNPVLAKLTKEERTKVAVIESIAEYCDTE